MIVASVRPDSWNIPLFLHVLGAMVLVGALVAVASALLLALRPGAAGTAVLPRFAFRTLLLGAVPAWLVMRLGAEWIYNKEGFTGDNDPNWIGIGFTTADGGGIVLLITTILAYVGVRRAGDDGGGAAVARIVGALASLLLIAYIVAVWAMTTKP
jgi:hypothetical protein